MNDRSPMTAALASVLICAIAGCASRPAPDEGQFLTVEIGNFRLSPSDVVYDMKYGLFEPSGAGMVARITFENPADSKAPFVVDVALREGVTEFDALSPPMRCIANGRRYNVRAQLLRDGAVMDTVSQDLLFRVPADLLKTMSVGTC
jgi:hypothetical protein